MLQYPMIVLADSDGPEQTARMRSLIWAFAVRIYRKIRFRISRSISLYMYREKSPISIKWIVSTNA